MIDVFFPVRSNRRCDALNDLTLYRADSTGSNPEAPNFLGCLMHFLNAASLPFPRLLMGIEGI